MDVNQQETDKAFIDNHVDLIIHGHTHRPAIHHKKVNGRNTTRVVLGDWFEKGSYLRVNDSSELKLQSFK
jgi:UDP-2,3-diacylglucosamine hydrolase